MTASREPKIRLYNEFEVPNNLGSSLLNLPLNTLHVGSPGIEGAIWALFTAAKGLGYSIRDLEALVSDVTASAAAEMRLRSTFERVKTTPPMVWSSTSTLDVGPEPRACPLPPYDTLTAATYELVKNRDTGGQPVPYVEVEFERASEVDLDTRSMIDANATPDFGHGIIAAFEDALEDWRMKGPPPGLRVRGSGDPDLGPTQHQALKSDDKP